MALHKEFITGGFLVKQDGKWIVKAYHFIAPIYWLAISTSQNLFMHMCLSGIALSLQGT